MLCTLILDEWDIDDLILLNFVPVTSSLLMPETPARAAPVKMIS